MALPDTLPEILSFLSTYVAYDQTETGHVARLRSFLQTSKQPFSDANILGHITGSAVVVDNQLAHLLLLWHEKLKRWLQPGGHCDLEVDGCVRATALRELEEETGISAAELCSIFETPFDIDIHLVPPRGSLPAHLHYDVRYLFKLRVERCTWPSGVQWLSVNDAACFSDSSIARFARKVSRIRERDTCP